MRSSGSTRSPSPEPPIPLYLWIAGEDHPRACTGRRLTAAGLVRRLDLRRGPPRGLLLDPHAPLPLSRADRALAAEGISAVDCSWNRLNERGGYPAGPVDRVPPERRRRLPLLLAGNPHHYGRVGELNTAEALAAALTVLGSPAQGRELLDRIGSGDGFLVLNRAPLSDYMTARSAEEVERAESEYF